MTGKNVLRAEMKKRLRDASATAGTIHFSRPSFICTPGNPVSPQTCAALFAYLPFGDEADPSEAIQTALSRNVPVCVPRVIGETLQFHRIYSLDGPFTSNKYGIREPLPSAPPCFTDTPGGVSPDIPLPLLILVPALAFGKDGSRLGRGGGYYDRFLNAVLSQYRHTRQEVTLAGVCRNIQVVDHVPCEDHDIPVDCLYTDEAVYLKG